MILFIIIFYNLCLAACSEDTCRESKVNVRKEAFNRCDPHENTTLVYAVTTPTEEWLEQIHVCVTKLQPKCFYDGPGTYDTLAECKRCAKVFYKPPKIIKPECERTPKHRTNRASCTKDRTPVWIASHHGSTFEHCTFWPKCSRNDTVGGTLFRSFEECVKACDNNDKPEVPACNAERAYGGCDTDKYGEIMGNVDVTPKGNDTLGWFHTAHGCVRELACLFYTNDKHTTEATCKSACPSQGSLTRPPKSPSPKTTLSPTQTSVNPSSLQAIGIPSSAPTSNSKTNMGGKTVENTSSTPLGNSSPSQRHRTTENTPNPNENFATTTSIDDTTKNTSQPKHNFTTATSKDGTRRSTQVPVPHESSTTSSSDDGGTPAIRTNPSKRHPADVTWATVAGTRSNQKGSQSDGFKSSLVAFTQSLDKRLTNKTEQKNLSSSITNNLSEAAQQLNDMAKSFVNIAHLLNSASSNLVEWDKSDPKELAYKTATTHEVIQNGSKVSAPTSDSTKEAITRRKQLKHSVPGNRSHYAKNKKEKRRNIHQK